MNILGAIQDVLEASSQSANRGGGGDGASEGAYWCDDCDVRIRDVELAENVEGRLDEGPTRPSCPECGEGMRFERSAASTGCAC